MTPQQFFESLTPEQHSVVSGCMIITGFLLFTTLICLWALCVLPKHPGTTPIELSLPMRMMLEIADKEGWKCWGDSTEHITYKNLTVFVTDTKIFAIIDYTSSPQGDFKKLFTEKELASIHPKYLALRKSLQDKQDKTSLTEALTKFTKALS